MQYLSIYTLKNLRSVDSSLHFKPIINSDHIIILNLSSKFRMYEALVAPYLDNCSKVHCMGMYGKRPALQEL